MIKSFIAAVVGVLLLAGCSSDFTGPPAETSGTGVFEQASPFDVSKNCEQYPYAVGCPQPTPPEPSAKASDFRVDLKVKSKQCFGSAGCNVMVEAELGYNGESSGLGSCEVTYEVTGDEDGPIIETLRSHGSDYVQQMSLVSTTSSKVVPTAKVTDVSCN